MTDTDLTASHKRSLSGYHLNNIRSDHSGGVLLQGQNIRPWLHCNLRSNPLA